MQDNGGEFAGVFAEWVRTKNIKRLKTKARDPHTNGSAERAVRFALTNLLF